MHSAERDTCLTKWYTLRKERLKTANKRNKYMKTKKEIKGRFNTDPTLHRKAIEAAKGKPRPNRMSKKKRTEKVKEELIKEELLRSGFVQQVGKMLPKINAALIKSATNPRFQSAQDRKTVYTAVGILGKEDKEIAKGIGEILAGLIANNNGTKR